MNIPDTGFGSWREWVSRAQAECGATFRIDGVYQPNSRWHRVHNAALDKYGATVLQTSAKSHESVTRGEANRGDIIEEVT